MPKRPPMHTVSRAAGKAKVYKKARVNPYKHLYDWAWQKYTKAFLSKPVNALCTCGCGELSKVVDHITPHKGNYDLFWNTDNHQGMAKTCHDAKTARVDGGFGNPRQGGAVAR